MECEPNPLTTFFTSGHKSVRLPQALSPLTTDPIVTLENMYVKHCANLPNTISMKFQMIEQIINFMLKALEDDEEEVVMESCDFGQYTAKRATKLAC